MSPELGQTEPNEPEGPRSSRSRLKLSYLASIDIFRDLSPEDMQEVERMSAMATAGKGKVIYVPEETGEVLFILKKGKVQIYRLSSDGRKFVLANLNEGTVFGEMALLGQGMVHSFAEAQEDATLCVMSRNDVEKLILTRPQVALRLMHIMGERLREVEGRLEEMSFKDVATRVASLLLRLSQGRQTTIEGWSHQDLADMLGVYRETVTNVLDDLKRRGILDLGRRRIAVQDPNLLKKAAEGLDK